MIWIEGENAENEQRMVDAKKTEEVVEESKRLLSSSDWFEVAVGSGMREALKNWNYGNLSAEYPQGEKGMKNK